MGSTAIQVKQKLDRTELTVKLLFALTLFKACPKAACGLNDGIAGKF